MVKNFGDINIVKELTERARYSPDIPYLNKNYGKYLPVFLYDEFKTGFKKDGVLKGGLYLGSARTSSNYYKMFESENEIIVLTGTKNDEAIGFIKGEAWALPLENLMVIDKEKRNGVLFRRQQTHVFLLDQYIETTSEKKMNPCIPVMMHVGEKEVWNDAEDIMRVSPMIEKKNNRIVRTYHYSGIRTKELWEKHKFQSPFDWTY